MSKEHAIVAFKKHSIRRFSMNPLKEAGDE
jgi:hypothetical protein